MLLDNKATRREQRICGDSQDRPGDIFHPDFTDGRPTYFDVSVTNTLQSGSIAIASIAAGSVGLEAEMRKDDKHAANVGGVGGVFVPLVVETLGVWTPSALKVLRRVAARTTVNSGLDTRVAARYLLQSLSCKLWAYNAKLLLHFKSSLPCTEGAGSPLL